MTKINKQPKLISQKITKRIQSVGSVCIVPPHKLMSTGEKGRLVLNHSTHLQGLIPILEKLTEISGIQTITPGEIGRVKGHIPKLKVRVSIPIRGGFKAIARQGKTVQEVFILTDLSKEELQAVIEKILRS